MFVSDQGGDLEKQLKKERITNSKDDQQISTTETNIKDLLHNNNMLKKSCKLEEVKAELKREETLQTDNRQDIQGLTTKPTLLQAIRTCNIS